MKASEQVQYVKNPNGPVIGTVSRQIIERDGLYFKDIDGSGVFQPFDDWRLPPQERAASLVRVLTTREKLGQLFISDWRMGRDQSDPALRDDSGLLDEGTFTGKTIFGEQTLPGTTTLIRTWWARHLILRANPRPEELADFVNQLNAVAEACARFVPVQLASNSRNESGKAVFGMNDATGVFTAWPGTLGIAAAILGDDITLADRFADCVRRQWDAVGLKKGYMYMADVLTDPRWQRAYGTFGEDEQLIAEIMRHIVPRIQGSESGPVPDGVAMTVKHFPGGGARENGFDPHYAMGQWNVYATPGSLQRYHLPGFRAAVKAGVSSVMPYYAKPSAEKSAQQLCGGGKPVAMKPLGFAYNDVFTQELLRGELGFKGYINSDTGIVHNMCWGVEKLDKPERIAYAVNAGGVDLISGLFDIEYGQQAMARAGNGYYETHPLPEGFALEDVTLSEAALDRAVTRTLAELFALGLFENPYRDPQRARQVVCENEADREEAMQAHRKSVVLLKEDGTLPLTATRFAGKTVYAECFAQSQEEADRATQALRSRLEKEVRLAADYAQADVALLLLDPSSGAYFHATAGYLELDICEDKTVCDVDEQGRPTAHTHTETTLCGMNRLRTVASSVHARGGKVIMHINFTLAWELGNVEPLADVLTAGFDTDPGATLDVLLGRFAPTGRLPMTLPRGDAVLAVDAQGVCVSPNDVPGYDKDRYLPESLKDETGAGYAYRDSAGNDYALGFGLRLTPARPQK